jgi:hypothetical protein
MHIGFWWESQNERDDREYLNIGGRIILIWTLERLDRVVLTGLIWLKIETFGFHKMLGNS